jgi:hypothetical protein
VAGGALWAAPVNAGLDLLDAGGIYSTDEMKNHRGNVHFWRQPVMGADGQPVRNSDGSPQLRSGFNPAAFGWNMAGHQRATTPDGTIVNGLSTGHPGLDAVGSYGSSAINASGPFQSAWALAQSAHEANPLNDTINPNTRRAWGDVFTRPGGARAGDTAGGSMPLIMANSLVSDPLQPNAPFMPGGPLFENGARPYREQNRYHATYNPTGRIGRPTGFLDWFSRPGY